MKEVFQLGEANSVLIWNQPKQKCNRPSVRAVLWLSFTWCKRRQQTHTGCDSMCSCGLKAAEAAHTAPLWQQKPWRRCRRWWLYWVRLGRIVIVRDRREGIPLEKARRPWTLKTHNYVPGWCTKNGQTQCETMDCTHTELTPLSIYNRRDGTLRKRRKRKQIEA